MFNYSLQCSRCGAEFNQAVLNRCPLCKGVLLLQPALHQARSGLRRLFNFEVTDMWKYRELLPVPAPPSADTLQEGGTPLLSAVRLGEQAGVGKLRLKNETVNPTGSFKDRQVAAGVAAIPEGLDTLAVISSGNVAAAAAAQAARRGLKCFVFVAAAAPEVKLIQAAAYGARVCRVDSASSSLIMDLVEEASRREGWYHLSTAGCFNPFSVEGSKTIAYELFEQYEGVLPDWIFVPVGGGGLLGGLWRGLLDLQELGLAERLPRLVGVQAAGCAPLIRAVEENWDLETAAAFHWENPQSIAGGIADDVLFDAHRALPAIRHSGGTAVAVSDEAILDAMRLLASYEGVFAEPSGAASLAGLISLRDTGQVKQEHSVCCLITGSGLKDITSAGKISAPAVVAIPELDNLVKAVRC